MTDAEINGMFTVALLAALADGNADERERAQLRDVATRIGGDRIDLAVLDRTPGARPTIAEAVRPLSTPEVRRHAYEVAVAVAAADGAHTPAEGAFLRDLASALGLPAQGAQSFVVEADAPPHRPPRSRAR
jgi:tellurite resistance protein